MYFCLAPKPTSPDVVALRLKIAPTSPQVPPETGVTPTPTATSMAPPTTAAPGTEAVPTEQVGPTEGVSGSGLEGSGLSPPGDLSVTNVTQTSLSLTWSAPESSNFDGFHITLAPSAQTALTQVKQVNGSARSAHIDGLLAGTQYEVSLYGMVAGEQSQPILVLANTTKGTRT